MPSGSASALPVSATHGHGTGDLLDRFVELLPEREPQPETDEAVRVAVIGRPKCGQIVARQPLSRDGTG